MTSMLIIKIAAGLFAATVAALWAYERARFLDALFGAAMLWLFALSFVGLLLIMLEGVRQFTGADQDDDEGRELEDPR